MYQIDNNTASTILPPSTAVGTPGFFSDGNPAAGQSATVLPAEFLNMLMLENLNVLQAGNITPAKGQFNQLSLAIANIVKSYVPAAPAAASETTAGVLMLSTNTQVIAGTDNTTAVTPLKLAQKLANYISQATETVFGWAKVATQVLTNAGADDTTFITPKKFAGAVQAGAFSFATDTGTANTYICNFTPAITARSESAPLRFKVKTANNGACTINDGLGAVGLVGGAHLALQGGELFANGDAWIQWNASVGAYVLLFCTGGAEQVAPASQSAHAVNAGQIQTQALTAFTTAGTAPAFTLSPVPAITAYTANQRFQVVFNASGGAAPTLNVSGQGPKSLKQYSAIGTKVAAIVINGQVSDVVYDGTDLVVLDQLPNASGTTAAQFDNSTNLATTAFVEGVVFQFSSTVALSVTTTLTAVAHAGALIIGNSASAINVILPAASTMPNKTVIKFFNNAAGTMTIVCAGSDTITNGGVANFALPAGAWITLASNGGGAWYMIDQSGLGVGQTYQNLTASRVFGTTYTNTTGKAITIIVSATAGAGTYTFMSASINGGTAFPFSAGDSPSGATYIAGTLVVPAGATYNITCGITLNVWWELR